MNSNTFDLAIRLLANSLSMIVYPLIWSKVATVDMDCSDLAAHCYDRIDSAADNPYLFLCHILLIDNHNLFPGCRSLSLCSPKRNYGLRSNPTLRTTSDKRWEWRIGQRAPRTNGPGREESWIGRRARVGRRILQLPMAASL